jgi:hypothetical protein
MMIILYNKTIINIAVRFAIMLPNYLALINRLAVGRLTKRGVPLAVSGALGRLLCGALQPTKTKGVAHDKRLRRCPKHMPPRDLAFVNGSVGRARQWARGLRSMAYI